MSNPSDKFTIQPFPGPNDNPNVNPNPGAGAAMTTDAPGLQKLDKEKADKLEKPLSSEELKKRTEALNS
ncbi:hypothetical protein MVES1_000017 [Malassezia vespertilionis]|uniref:uncharacterized protein n=1 Tax=Malassezia vespertilionis TaxID=2020962 RepID=UPI0024B092C0|nr:uncharacterized protein MVES1_000017 [Malassezia vespertilionis]WFD04694.1 hypothetical protein MVES1_000017 [Malassezia vespertilionis]